MKNNTEIKNETRNVAACIIMNHKNEILLQKKTEDYKYSRCWALFGGGIEGDETPEEAIIRELKEELGLYISKIKKIKEDYYTNGNQKTVFHIFTTLFERDISEIRIGEGCGVAFFSLEEIKQLKMIPHSLNAITEFLENQ